MTNVIVALKNPDNARKIKSFLLSQGFNVISACTSAAQVLSCCDELHSGLVVCSAAMQDMMYGGLRAELPESFHMLVIANPDELNDAPSDNMLFLNSPFKFRELQEKASFMIENLEFVKRRKRRTLTKRSPEEERDIQNAKHLLMEKKGFTEKEAHRYIQKRSMESGVGIAEMAQMVLRLVGNER